MGIYTVQIAVAFLLAAGILGFFLMPDKAKSLDLQNPPPERLLHKAATGLGLTDLHKSISEHPKDSSAQDSIELPQEDEVSFELELRGKKAGWAKLRKNMSRIKKRFCNMYEVYTVLPHMEDNGIVSFTKLRNANRLTKLLKKKGGDNFFIDTIGKSDDIILEPVACRHCKKGCAKCKKLKGKVMVQRVFIKTSKYKNDPEPQDYLLSVYNKKSEFLTFCRKHKIRSEDDWLENHPTYGEQPGETPCECKLCAFRNATLTRKAANAAAEATEAEATEAARPVSGVEDVLLSSLQGASSPESKPAPPAETVRESAGGPVHSPPREPASESSVDVNST